jgi:hypothetical protein
MSCEERVMGKKTGFGNMDILAAVGFLIVWFALQMWILPRFGVST